jgi:putative DNA methylase
VVRYPNSSQVGPSLSSPANPNPHKRLRRLSAIHPQTIFYAFKQAETDLDGTASTGWETFLAGVIENGFAITATWPVRTELVGNLKKSVSALASSIVLACVPRPTDAPMVTRRDFANTLHSELPGAIKHLQSGNVAPVDLAQASIGPGMAVFSRYSKVINADGSPMSVREALQLINQVLDESLVEQESDFDSETRFAIRWFEQYGMKEGPFGDAETLAKAMAVAVRGVVEAGIAKSGAGKVRLLAREELDPDWNPKTDTRLTMWEVTQHLIHRLETGGEMAAAELVRDVSSERGEIAKELAYRLYQTCDRKKWAEEARRYNAFVASWPEIVRLSRQQSSRPQQAEMF